MAKRKLSWEESRFRIETPNRAISHVDMFGQQLAVGDWIVYAVGSGDMSVAKMGRISRLVPFAQPPADRWYEGPKPTKVQAVTASMWGGGTCSEDMVPDTSEDTFDIQNHGYPITIAATERLVKVPTESVPERVRQEIDKYWEPKD